MFNKNQIIRVAKQPETKGQIKLIQIILYVLISCIRLVY